MRLIAQSWSKHIGYIQRVRRFDPGVVRGILYCFGGQFAQTQIPMFANRRLSNPNDGYIAHVQFPGAIFHNEDMLTIPAKNSQKLFEVINREEKRENK